jgi:Fur family iron response transcriptional regulator
MQHYPSSPAAAPVGSRLCSRLKNAGLRRTRQRIALAKIVFCRGNRYLTAEMVHEEATADRIPVSLATVYNTLHQFEEAGLLRQVAVTGGRAYYDADSSEHPHFFMKDEQGILNLYPANLRVQRLPEPPQGYEVGRVDVVVYLRRIAN